MNRVFKTARWEFTEKIRSKSFLISSLLVPIVIFLFILVPTYFASGDVSRTVQLGLLDQTGRFAGSLPEALNKKHLLPDGRPEFSLIPVGDSETGNRLLEDRILDGYIVIGQEIDGPRRNFVVRTRGNGYAHQAEKIRIELQYLVVKQILKRSALKDPDLEAALTHEIEMVVDDMSAGSDPDESRYLVGIIMMMLLFFSIFTSTGYFLRGVAEEKTNRVIELLISSMKPGELMAGKILGLGLLGLLQIAFWLLASYFLGREHVELILSQANIVLFFLYFVLGYLLIASVSAGIGSIVSSSDEIQQVNSLVSLLGILPIAFAVVVLQDPGSTLVNVLSYVPFLTPTLMILRLAISEPPLVHVVGTLLLLLTSVISCIWFSGKIFHTGVLMYGKRQSFREVLGAMRKS